MISTLVSNRSINTALICRGAVWAGADAWELDEDNATDETLQLAVDKLKQAHAGDEQRLRLLQQEHELLLAQRTKQEAEYQQLFEENRALKMKPLADAAASMPLVFQKEVPIVSCWRWFAMMGSGNGRHDNEGVGPSSRKRLHTSSARCGTFRLRSFRWSTRLVRYNPRAPCGARYVWWR